VRARRVFCQMAEKSMAYSGAEVVRLLGVFTSAANRFAAFEEFPESRRLLTVLQNLPPLRHEFGHYLDRAGRIAWDEVGQLGSVPKGPIPAESDLAIARGPLARVWPPNPLPDSG
jgi:hypothetical protein